MRTVFVLFICLVGYGLGDGDREDNKLVPIITENERRGSTLDNQGIESKKRSLFSLSGLGSNKYSSGYDNSGPSGYGYSGNSDHGYSGHGYSSHGFSGHGYGGSYPSAHGYEQEEYGHSGPGYGGYGGYSGQGGHSGHGVQHGGGEGGGLYGGLYLKKLLIPLAGIALLGAAAALSTNPVLLQLGVVNGKRKRSIEKKLLHGVYPTHPGIKPHNIT